MNQIDFPLILSINILKQPQISNGRQIVCPPDFDGMEAARRIVALWNSSLGIPTEDIEQEILDTAARWAVTPSTPIADIATYLDAEIERLQGQPYLQNIMRKERERLCGGKDMPTITVDHEI